jgi:hypothetical protein
MARLCQYLDTYLVRLLEDFEENPEDSNLDDNASDQAISRAEEQDAIRFDVFLSYSTNDKDQAREVDTSLKHAGKSCFLAETILQPGDKFEDEIRDALKASREFWVLVSPHSMNSAWVQREITAAWALEKQILPILFRCGPNDLPAPLNSISVIDFHQIKAYISRLR